LTVTENEALMRIIRVIVRGKEDSTNRSFGTLLFTRYIWDNKIKED
jgi:hypothetical protein